MHLVQEGTVVWDSNPQRAMSLSVGRRREKTQGSNGATHLPDEEPLAEEPRLCLRAMIDNLLRRVKKEKARKL
jgi:hypothetical protein